MTRRRPSSVHVATRSPRTTTAMIAGTLVAAVSFWSLMVAVGKHAGSNAHSVYLDGDRVRRVSAGGEPCCAGQSSSSTASVVASATADDDTANPREIPLNVVMELIQVTNVSELFTKFMPDTNMDEAQKRFITTGFQSRTAINLERRSAITPKPAECSTLSQTISLKDTDDRSLYYYPPCTRVDRCGGCTCTHDLLACQPTKIEKLHYEVLVSQYNGVGSFEYIGRKIVSIDRHLKCKCDCIVKEQDCGPLQTYNGKECRCKCSNVDDEEKCDNDHELKQWNSATCACECRETHECTSGYGFDNYTCRCEPIRIRTKNTGNQLNRNKYSLVLS